jgi:hypothetical protein
MEICNLCDGNFINQLMFMGYVTTLALGSRPRQGLAKVQAKNEA